MFDQRLKLKLSFNIDISNGLIKNEKWRIIKKRESNGEFLSHSGRKRFDAFSPNVPKVEHSELLLHLSKISSFQSTHEVGLIYYRSILIESEILGHIAHSHSSF